jgi:hypothetical protein
MSFGLNRLSDDVVDVIVDGYRRGRTARQLVESHNVSLSSIKRTCGSEASGRTRHSPHPEPDFGVTPSYFITIARATRAPIGTAGVSRAAGRDERTNLGRRGDANNVRELAHGRGVYVSRPGGWSALASGRACDPGAQVLLTGLDRLNTTIAWNRMIIPHNGEEAGD